MEVEWESPGVVCVVVDGDGYVRKGAGDGGWKAGRRLWGGCL